MGGQKGIALFYSFFSKKVPLTLVSTKNNAAPVNLQAEFIALLSNSAIRYINPLLFFYIKKIIKERQSTHLLIEHPYLGWLGWLIKKICGVQFIVHSHNIESIRFKSTGKWWWKILWYYERWSHQNADINFFITDEDRIYAIQHFSLNEKCCHTITYGFDLQNPPTKEDKKIAKEILIRKYNIPTPNTIILFNGTLDYKPNQNALDNILNQINPLLDRNNQFKYTILICGKNLPESYQNLQAFENKNIKYAGFVDDISLYFKGSDIFINPLTDGGGIKTKLVEALGYNLYCVSTMNGAIGVPEKITNCRMHVVRDNDWDNFSEAIILADHENTSINQEFYTYFYWGKIVEKAYLSL